MILECPNCDTHYEIPVELPPGGRKVRCASCQHIWQALPPRDTPEAESAPEPPAPGIAAAADETVAADETAGAPQAGADPAQSVLDEFRDEEIVFKEDEPAEEPEAPAPPADAETADHALSDDEMADAFSAAVAEAGMAQEEEREVEEEEPESAPIVIGKARKKKSVSLPANLAAGWAALALLLTGILSIGYFQRVTVVKLLPGAASTYERIGLPVNVRGLAFKGVKYSWETSAGRPVLEVFGEIENITSRPMKVPTVVFGLRTKEKVEVYQWAADVRAEMLPPGENTAFSAQIPTPPKSIRDVQVRFAKVQ